MGSLKQEQWWQHRKQYTAEYRRVRSKDATALAWFNRTAPVPAISGY